MLLLDSMRPVDGQYNRSRLMTMTKSRMPKSIVRVSEFQVSWHSKQPLGLGLAGLRMVMMMMLLLLLPTTKNQLRVGILEKNNLCLLYSSIASSMLVPCSLSSSSATMLPLSMLPLLLPWLILSYIVSALGKILPCVEIFVKGSLSFDGCAACMFLDWLVIYYFVR